MESSRSSRLTIYDESGAIIESPVEGRSYGIAVDIVKERWGTLSLKLGTMNLPLRMDEEALFAHAELPPCGPGQYELSLACGVFRESRKITVMPEHFTDGDVRSMMHDLTDQLPKSIASLLKRCGGLSGTTLAQGRGSSIEQEFANLTLAMRGTPERLGILQILPVLERECHMIMVSRHELRKANQVSRPDISKLPMAMSMADNIGPNGALKQMFEATVIESYETYENRLVKSYVQTLQGQLSRLQARLKSEPAPPAVASELEALASEFRLACTRASFLSKVRIPLTSAARITMVLLKNPAYRVVLEDYVSLHKQSSIRLAEPALDAPLNRFPYLYQIWANLTVINIMLQFCADSGYTCLSHHLIKRDNDGLFIQFMNAGEVAMELGCPNTGKVVSLVPWRLHAGVRDKQELPPSTIITIHSPDKAPVSLLFDPKYRVVEYPKQAALETVAKKKSSTTKKAGQNENVETHNSIAPMKEDIDELRQCMSHMKGADGVQHAQYGAILYPGERMQISAGLEALTALPSDQEALKKIVWSVFSHFLA